MTLRVGLIGLNYGARVHLPAFAANPRYEVLAVCARTPGRAQAVAHEHKVPCWFTDPRQLIAMPEIDLVSVATPPGSHGRLAAASLAAGKHVLVEVAFVPIAADARVLADMARESGRMAAAAYVLRYVPALRMVSRMLAQGDIGYPRLLCVDFFESLLARPEGAGQWRWLWDADQGGGVLAGFIAHFLDLACAWFGPVLDVDASLATLAEVRSLPLGRRVADDTGLVTLRFASGMLAAINYSAAVARERTRLELHGSQASLLIGGFGDDVLLQRIGQAEPSPVFVPPDLLEESRGQSGLPAGFQHFLHRLALAAAGQAAPDLPTFAAAYEVARLLDAIQLAAREHRRVRLAEVG
jgi:predicted dehydrogenase